MNFIDYNFKKIVDDDDPSLIDLSGGHDPSYCIGIGKWKSDRHIVDYDGKSVDTMRYEMDCIYNKNFFKNSHDYTLRRHT